MAFTFGGTTCIALAGVPDQVFTTDVLDQIDRPGLDGVAFRKMGKKAQAYQIGILIDSGGVSDTIKAFKDMVGTVITIADEQGRTLTNQLVIEVTPKQVQKVGSPTGGTVAEATHVCRLDALCIDGGAVA